MRKLHIILLLGSFLLSLIFISNTSAQTSGGIVISEVQLGGPVSAKHEFIEIYNNTENDIEVTNWCVHYQSSTLTQYELVCFTPEADSTHIFLPAQSTIFLISNDLHEYNPELKSDDQFSATLAGTTGYVRILDDQDQEIDRVGWGISSAENNLALAAPSGKVLSRKIISDKLLQDTDIYVDDFVVNSTKSIYLSGLLYDVVDVCSNIADIQIEIPDGYQLDELGDCVTIPVDICINLAGVQSELPDNYSLNEFNECQIDMCLNLEGLQSEVPEDLIQTDGNCAEHDVCLNLELIQATLPEGMIIGSSGDCINPAAKLILTELLPNAISSDDGNEYIEIYNPNNYEVTLAAYRIYIGANYSKWYDFPADSVIAPFSYRVFSDDDMGFQLINTSSIVRLATKDEIVDETIEYLNPKEGESWSIIDGTWQYTNQVTLGFANIVSLMPESGVVLAAVTELTPCAAGYYRNTETNRCRKVISEESELVPCRDGQYRSEETGRCRNIISDIAALVPCSEGEERNPSTNRCRKIVSEVSISLVPCNEGEERNPETNRCRKIKTSAVPAASYAPEKINSNSNSTIYIWSLSFIAFVAVNYGIWEWRQEIIKLFKKRS